MGTSSPDPNKYPIGVGITQLPGTVRKSTEDRATVVAKS